MRRLLLILAGLATFLGVAAAPAAAATYLFLPAYRHTFNGAAGTVTVTATRPLCGSQSQAVTLVSYTAVAGSGQFLYDSATGRLTATDQSLTLKVAVPGCDARVAAFFGTGIQTELTATTAPYGSARLDSRSSGPPAWYAGGSTTCTTIPTITYTYACDGTFTATLANGPAAGASAVFLTGVRRIRLSPGRSTTVEVAKGATLTVRDSSFTTHVASWRSPATGCVATPTLAPAIPPARPVATAPTEPASATVTPATTTTTATEPTYDAPVAYPRLFPDTTTAAAAARIGLGPGSVLLIGLGLLMVGAGIAAIAYLIRLNRRTE